MEPTDQLIKAFLRDDVERARRMSPGDKLLDGPRLFDLAAAFCKAGIRAAHPGCDESAVHEMFRQRLRMRQQMERR